MFKYDKKSFIKLLVPSYKGYKLINGAKLIETYNDKLSISVCADQYLDFFGIKRK